MPEFLSRRNYLVLFALIIISILILTIHFRESNGGLIHKAERLVMAGISPLQITVTKALTPVTDGWDYLAHFGEIKQENRRLQREVAELRGEAFTLRDLKKENARLQSLIGFKEQIKYDTIPARVTGMPSSNWWSSVIIDKGLSDGVKRNMPVVAGGGLVGQVVDSSQRAAKVLLLNDVQSGVSVQVERTGEVGVIKGQLRNQRLLLKYISRDSTIQNGDTVVTSGLGELFPKGIYVGRVVKVSLSSYGLYKDVEVETPVDLTSLEEVLVIKHEPDYSFKEAN